ncbi:Qat anti-phage system QueC-like protein QatC [uncultured Paludibaculum sp.]|uniref:Qat anti-phage system QueC-like protein QatC n=1 Tax=uncultured Paludibaculum sp. TaxID=1765020 RepID=UPI002AAB53A5|nr:Qat anti-phage system QueC-like protein QatC [uncultured Paludibaculum sp.]
MNRLYCTSSPKRAVSARKAGFLPVLLYTTGTPELAGIGHPIINECRELHRQPSRTAWDFLSLSLGVIAADSFVKRADAADGWTREIDLTVELLDPSPWHKVSGEIEKTLRFLTGDLWHLTFEPNGPAIPGQKRMVWKDAGCDAVCLFSGGLDSFIGALDLTASGLKPYFVSCAYPKDAEKQAALATRLSLLGNRHFQANPDPRWAHENETSMRARSLLFLALATLIASTLRLKPAEAPVPVFLPENGFISLNVPLTARRLGSLSTRTTHPHFIGGIQSILSKADLNIQILNPYQLRTKGEMMRDCRDSNALQKLAHITVSCGKWKRKSQQCGRCLPCLIRRAAFDAAGLVDSTDYRFHELSGADNQEDIIAVRLAYNQMLSAPGKWIRRTGPMPEENALRAEFADVFVRGLNEVGGFVTRALP